MKDYQKIIKTANILIYIEKMGAFLGVFVRISPRQRTDNFSKKSGLISAQTNR